MGGDIHPTSSPGAGVYFSRTGMYIGRIGVCTRKEVKKTRNVQQSTKASSRKTIQERPESKIQHVQVQSMRFVVCLLISDRMGAATVCAISKRRPGEPTKTRAPVLTCRDTSTHTGTTRTPDLARPKRPNSFANPQPPARDAQHPLNLKKPIA